MKYFMFISLLLGTSLGIATETSTEIDLSRPYSPFIRGNTLYIQGTIDSHIYDYFSYEARALESVTYISLNSYGGSHNWAKEIGRRIQELQKITVVSSSNVCASACIYLFGSGVERWMSANTWLGIHGARLGGGYTVNFLNSCFDVTNSVGTFNSTKEGCPQFLDHWHRIAFAETQLAFDLIETAGVSATLFEHYMSLPDEPNWFSRSNILRTEDWKVTPPEALHFNLATKLIDEMSALRNF